MQQEGRYIKFEDYLLMFLLLFMSGNPAVCIIDPYHYLLVILMEVFFFGKRLSSVGKKKAVRWSALMIVIFVGQYFTLHKIGILASANYIFKLLVAIFAADILKEKFSYTYLKVISTLSVIALVLWGINLFGIHFPPLLRFENSTDSLIVYTQQVSGNVFGRDGLLRNAGMFWEPGAYAGYIMLAFFLYINQLDHLWVKHRKEVLVLTIALLSTFSTTGYIVFTVIFFFFLTKRVKNKSLFIVVMMAALLGIAYFFESIDFLNDKLRNEYENAMTTEKYDVNFSRMGSLVFDWAYIKMHPVFGNGLLNETRFSQHIAFADNLSAFGNGFSGEIAYFGLPFMLIFLFAIYRNSSLKKKGLLLLLFVLQMQGEYFMNYPLFLIFPFVFFFNETDNRECSITRNNANGSTNEVKLPTDTLDI